MRRAFTILELLAATALTALLMIAVLHVVGTIGSSRAALARQGDAGAWRADLVDTLRRDLGNATKVSFRNDALILTSHGALGPQTMAFTHEPVTVVYALADIDGRSWLVRRESPRDGLSHAPAWAELLCPDITGLSIRPLGISAGGASGVMPMAAGQDVPSAVSVILAGSKGPVMNETVVLR